MIAAQRRRIGLLREISTRRYCNPIATINTIKDPFADGGHLNLDLL